MYLIWYVKLSCMMGVFYSVLHSKFEDLAALNLHRYEISLNEISPISS